MINQITEMYIGNRKKYVNMMSRILKGDYAAAEDVVQEAFTRAIYFQHSYDETRASLETWFNTILFNALRTVQKEMRGDFSGAGDLGVEDLFVQDEFVKSPEFSELMHKKILSEKNQKHRRILELFFILGYTSSDISQIEEKTSVTNVTSIVSRFRNRLAKELKWKHQ